MTTITAPIDTRELADRMTLPGGPLPFGITLFNGCVRGGALSPQALRHLTRTVADALDITCELHVEILTRDVDGLHCTVFASDSTDTVSMTLTLPNGAPHLPLERVFDHLAVTVTALHRRMDD